MNLSDFFPPAMVPQDLATTFHSLPPLSAMPRNFMLTGQPHSGKSTLLFHLAYTLAQKGESVMILASRNLLEDNPPSLSPSIPGSNPGWSNIQIKYIEDMLSLLHYASLLHISPHPPNIILIDNLEKLPLSIDAHGSRNFQFLPSESYSTVKGKEAMLCRLLAVLSDSMEFVSQSTGKSTLLGVTCETQSPTEQPISQSLLERWLPVVLGIRPWKEGTYRVSLLEVDHTNNQGHSPVGPCTEYSIQGGRFAIEHVVYSP